MNVYPCTVEKCGRKFTKKEELKEHFMRRHSNQPPSNSAVAQIKNTLEPIHSETTFNLKANKITLSEAAKTIIKKPLSLPRKKLPTPLLKPTIPEKLLLKEKGGSAKDIPEETSFKTKAGNSLHEDKSHENTTNYSMSFNKDASENFTGNLVDLNQDKKIFDDLMKDEDDENELDDILDSPQKQEKVELKQIMDSRDKLTEEYLVRKSGIFDKIEQISTLVLRDEGLYAFESHEKLKIDRFIGLEYLCLSHNKLFNLHGVGECVNLIDLNLSFNNIEDIYPLKNCTRLEKLWLSNNLISDIKVLSELKNLKLVSLYKNKLKSLDEIVVVFRQLPKLEELDLDRNPATKKYLYKYDILYSLHLSMLDGEHVSEIDYELAKSFKQERIAKAKNLDDPNLQRPSTAPGKIRSHFQNGLSNDGAEEHNYTERFKDKIGKLTKEANKLLNDIPEGAEKYYELEQEFEVLKGERNQLKKELEESQSREENLQRKIKNLETEAIIKQIESNSVYILADENKSLKDKLRTYEQIYKDESKPETVYLEKLFVAHMKIDELLAENAKLQAQISPKVEKVKKNDAPKFYNTFSTFPKFRESGSFSNDIKASNEKKASLNKSLSFSNAQENDLKIEAELQKNSDNIEKLKMELRSMMESVDEQNHEDSFGDNNIFDPEL